MLNLIFCTHTDYKHQNPAVYYYPPKSTPHKKICKNLGKFYFGNNEDNAQKVQ